MLKVELSSAARKRRRAYRRACNAPLVAELTSPAIVAYPWSGAMKMARRGANIPQAQLDNAPQFFPEPEQAVREFDYAAGCWVRVPTHIPETPPPPPAPIPFNDGSRVFWVIVDRMTDLVLWTIEARDWREALAEKRALCRASRYRSGDAKILPA